MLKKSFHHTVVAGTFDRLHKGHQYLLSQAAHQSHQLSCGLTTQAFVSQSQKKLKPIIQPYNQRLQQLSKQLPVKTPIFPLNDPCGPALTHPDFDSIAVTPDTQANAKLINQKRQQKHLAPLTPILVDLIPAQDSNQLSSTRIRWGQINRSGLNYHQLLPRKTAVLSDHHRYHFQLPFGQLIRASSQSLDWATIQLKQRLVRLKPTMIIAVGDLTTQTFIRHQIPFNLAIFDYRIQRQPIPEKLPLADCPVISVKNPAGCLHISLVTELKKLLTKPLNLISTLIQVQGEEDLAVIPLVLLSPLNTFIFYGQPNKGLVQLKVTEKTKTKAQKLLSYFSG